MKRGKVKKRIEKNISSDNKIIKYIIIAVLVIILILLLGYLISNSVYKISKKKAYPGELDSIGLASAPGTICSNSPSNPYGSLPVCRGSDANPPPNPAPSPSPSPTQSPNPSPSPSPTQSPTQSPTPTQSPNPSPSPSPTQSPTQSPTPTPLPKKYVGCSPDKQNCIASERACKYEGADVIRSKRICDQSTCTTNTINVVKMKKGDSCAAEPYCSVTIHTVSSECSGWCSDIYWNWDSSRSCYMASYKKYCETKAARAGDDVSEEISCTPYGDPITPGMPGGFFLPRPECYADGNYGCLGSCNFYKTEDNLNKCEKLSQPVNIAGNGMGQCTLQEGGVFTYPDGSSVNLPECPTPVPTPPPGMSPIQTPTPSPTPINTPPNI